MQSSFFKSRLMFIVCAHLQPLPYSAPPSPIHSCYTASASSPCSSIRLIPALLPIRYGSRLLLALRQPSISAGSLARSSHRRAFALVSTILALPCCRPCFRRCRWPSCPCGRLRCFHRRRPASPVVPFLVFILVLAVYLSISLILAAASSGPLPNPSPRCPVWPT